MKTEETPETTYEAPVTNQKIKNFLLKLKLVKSYNYIIFKTKYITIYINYILLKEFGK